MPNPFISGFVENNVVYKDVGYLQRDSDSSLLSPFNQVFLVYMAERSFSIVGSNKVSSL